MLRAEPWCKSYGVVERGTEVGGMDRAFRLERKKTRIRSLRRQKRSDPDKVLYNLLSF